MSTTRKTRNTTRLNAQTTTATKKRRISVLDDDALPELPPLDRLHDLLTQAATVAKLVKPSRKDTAAISTARKLANAIINALPIDETTGLIDYENHDKSLRMQLKSFQKSVKNDWKDGWEEQGEMMGEISGEILGWMEDLWLAMADDADLGLIQPCLVLCANTVRSLQNSNSRSEYGDMDFPMTIKQDDRTIYNSSYSMNNNLAWMWRELLVFSACQNRPTTIILANIKQLDLDAQVFDLIRRNGATITPDGDEYFDSHWSNEMRAAANALCVNRHSAAIAAFKASPSIGKFRSLKAEAPGLSSILLDLLHGSIFCENPTIPYNQAASFFIGGKDTANVLKLLDSHFFYNKPASSQRDMAKYLYSQPSQEHRDRAKRLLTNGLKQASQDVLAALQDVFPELDEAEMWLEEAIDGINAKLAKKLKKDVVDIRNMSDKESKRALENLIEKFTTKARNGMDYGEHDYHRYSDPDSEGGGEHNSGPDLVRPIQDWVQLLGEWEDRAEAARIWDEVKAGDEPWIVAHGAIESLAYSCGYDYNGSGRGQYVSDAIPALVKTYGCKNLKELAKYTPKCTSRGIFSSTTMPSYF